MYTIQYAKNLVWDNVEHTMFDCIVKYVEFPEEMPTTVTPTDPTEHIHELWVNGTAGIYGPITEYIPPAPPPIVPPTADQNKQSAMNRLQETDWTATDDVGNPQRANPYLVNQSEFFTYRSAVREIAVNPVAGVLQWPTKPVEQWSN